MPAHIKAEFYLNLICLIPICFQSFHCRLNPSDAEVGQIGREIDADGNGEIDFEEFLSIMKSDLLRWDTDSKGASLEGRKMHLANFCEELHQIFFERCSWWAIGRSIQFNLYHFFFDVVNFFQRDAVGGR